MSTPNSYSRREFFKNTPQGLAVGIIAGAAMVPVKITANEVTEAVSDMEVGNASARVRYEQCLNGSLDACADEPEYHEKVIIGPVIEEILFRSIPSRILNKATGMRDQGEDTLGLTRREWITGTVTSVGFGAIHNVTSEGFDTNTIPTSQTIGGMSYWWLHRRYGSVANIPAHMINNATGGFWSRLLK